MVGMEAQSRRGGLLTDVLALPPTVEQRSDALERARDVLAVIGLEEYAHTPAGDLPIGLSRMVELGRAVCGDGTCDANEDSASCPEDCGPCGTIAATGGMIDNGDRCYAACGAGSPFHINSSDCSWIYGGVQQIRHAELGAMAPRSWNSGCAGRHHDPRRCARA